MRIAVNTRCYGSPQIESCIKFFYELFIYLAKHQSQHQFFFLFDKAPASDIAFPSNVVPVVIGPASRQTLASRWWFDVKVPLALKKYKADVFVSAGGCSLFSNVPQVLMIHDLAHLLQPNLVPKFQLLFAQRIMPRFLKAATAVVTPSRFAAATLIDKYNLDIAKVSTMYGAPSPIFQPLEWQDRENTKEKFADGSEYFVFSAAIEPRNNLLNLLKAFSLFKKRQRSNMKLVIAGSLSDNHKDFSAKMATYKYRHDVVLTGYLAETDLAQLIAGAYAMVHPTFMVGSGLAALQAMQCNVPVIISENAAMVEIMDEAALFVDSQNPANIADQMKFIYTNESTRSRLIEKGHQVVARFSWPASAHQMWTAIEQAVSK